MAGQQVVQALAEGRSINTAFITQGPRVTAPSLDQSQMSQMSPKLNRELRDRSSPGHPEPGEGQGILFPTNTHDAFHPYSEPKDFTPTRSIPAKTKQNRKTRAHAQELSTSVASSHPTRDVPRGKRQPSPTAFLSSSVITPCYCWFRVFFFFSLHKQWDLPLLFEKVQKKKK